ncbi:MAG TPA: flagellar hook-basal body complex protein FliE [Acidobacteriaceae bacterium]|jgi:flagellar hook-basal body complex protein FliE|nr:flagellar hook-basal body complex protein FliE [Acidobacteriaceae bacterium]
MQAAAIASLVSAGGVAGLGPAGLGPAAAAAAPPASSGTPFGDLLKDTVTGIDSLKQQAASAVTGVLDGSGVDIHDAMIATQKADMSFELALAVRNKAVAAYQQVMGMQF